jgi:hypothetical protein
MKSGYNDGEISAGPRLRERRISNRPRSKIVDDKSIYFVHIPKTAGTSLNAFISSHYQEDECEIHFENRFRWRDPDGIKYLRRKKYLSGHVRYPVFRNRMPKIEHMKFSIFRDPIEQLISHLVWVRHLCEPQHKAEYDRHPEHIQETAQKLASTDFTKPAALKAFVASMSRHERGLFDNCQTRYFLPNLPSIQLQDKYLRQALGNLAELDVVGVTDRYIQTLMVLCHRMGWAVPDDTPQMNVTGNLYGLDRNAPATLDALSELIRYDTVLYELARNRIVRDFYGMLVELDLASGGVGDTVNLANIRERLAECAVRAD